MRILRWAPLLALALPGAAHAASPALAVGDGDTAWMLTATLLVLMMSVPGLALFYGGLVRAKNMLSIASQVLGITAVTILVWFGWGYSLAFAPGNAFVGDTSKLFLTDIGPEAASATFSAGAGIPELAFAAFQMTFAAIAAALIIGALAERVRFSALLLFAALWITLVYAPIAHMAWSSDGLIFGMGALDFAGGTVVHINAGVAGLVGVFFAGKRIGFLREPMAPHSLTMTFIGTGLLWVGWFGFNAGSALQANGTAALAMMNTFLAPAAGILAWMAVERWQSGKPSTLGGASGAIAGLVAITPAAGTSGFLGAVALGAAGAVGCYLFVAVAKNRLQLDDSLDAFGIHGIAGIIGSIGTAIVSAPALGGFGVADYDMGRQLLVQSGAVLIAIAWSAAGSALCFFIVQRAIRLRVDHDSEREGLDLTEHGERAYNY